MLLILENKRHQQLAQLAKNTMHTPLISVRSGPPRLCCAAKVFNRSISAWEAFDRYADTDRVGWDLCLNSRRALRVSGFSILSRMRDRSERAYLRSSSFSAERVNGILDKLSQNAGGGMNLFVGGERRPYCESSGSVHRVFVAEVSMGKSDRERVEVHILCGRNRKKADEYTLEFF